MTAGVAWSALLVAGLLEVGFTTCMRLSDGFRIWGWSIGFGICAFLSFAFLNYASRTIPLGLSYAVWVGIGAVGTALIGRLFFAEGLTPAQIALLAGLIACIVGLRLTSGAAV